MRVTLQVPHGCTVLLGWPCPPLDIASALTALHRRNPAQGPCWVLLGFATHRWCMDLSAIRQGLLTHQKVLKSVSGLGVLRFFFLSKYMLSLSLGQAPGQELRCSKTLMKGAVSREINSHQAENMGTTLLICSLLSWSAGFAETNAS